MQGTLRAQALKPGDNTIASTSSQHLKSELALHTTFSTELLFLSSPETQFITIKVIHPSLACQILGPVSSFSIAGVDVFAKANEMQLRM